MSGSFAIKEWPLGGLFLADRPMASSLPLRHTEVEAHITGPLAAVAVTQHYHNPFDAPLELEYLFPLPENGAIYDFEFLIGAAKVKAEVQPAETARERYETALHGGQRASLFEERRPNLFALLLANVQPGDEITAVLRYQQPLAFVENSYEWVFPMGVTPKYHRDPAEAEVTDSPLALPGEEIGGIGIAVHIDAGQAAEDPVSPSHPLRITRLDGSHFEIGLAGEQIPDRDFVLRYRLAEAEVACPVWISGDSSAATALVTLVPNSWPSEVSAPPREFIFVLDRSGSMAGEPLHQAVNALAAGLRTMRPADTFLLLAFDNEVEWCDRIAAAYSQESLERADHWLTQITARGGTEIGLALRAALGVPADAERQRHILFFTDGAVSAEEQVLAEVRRGIRNSRIFTFGIGPSVNRAFINSLARLGRGTSEFLQLDEDIEVAIIRFHDRLSYPLLQDLHLRWEGTTAWDVLPAELPDLYYGQPLMLLAKFRPGAEARLILSGRCGGAAWEKSLLLPEVQIRAEVILRTWARARIDLLLDRMHVGPRRTSALRDEIIGLALEHHLVTEFTSLVAVQEEVVSAVPAQRLKVAVPLPQGLEAEGFLADHLVNASMPMQCLQTELSLVRRLRSRVSFQLAEPAAPAPEHLLAGLARRQMADGSWGEGGQALERSCAAVLAFIRSGYTLARGPYRRILEKAVTWLLHQQPGDPLGQEMRAVALWEMKQACSHPLLQGVGAAEEAIVHSLPAPDFTAVRTPAQLRQAALSGVRVEIRYTPPAGEVGELWLECIK